MIPIYTRDGHDFTFHLCSQVKMGNCCSCCCDDGRGVNFVGQPNADPRGDGFPGGEVTVVDHQPSFAR